MTECGPVGKDMEGKVPDTEEKPSDDPVEGAAGGNLRLPGHSHEYSLSTQRQTPDAELLEKWDVVLGEVALHDDAWFWNRYRKQCRLDIASDSVSDLKYSNQNFSDAWCLQKDIYLEYKEVVAGKGDADAEGVSKKEKDQEENVCYIHQLPREILLYIFSFFTVPDLCLSIAPVCRSWHSLAQDAALWTSLVFPYQRRVPSNKVLDLVRKSTFLVSLDIQSREDGKEVLLQVAESCKRLQYLSIKFCDGLTENVLRELVDNCKDLRFFNVEGTKMYDCVSCRILSGFKQLRHLNLSHCLWLDDIGLVKIAQECVHLEYLNIDGITDIRDEGVLQLTKHRCQTLTNLILDGENLTDVAYVSLGFCSKLKELGITFCIEMTDNGLKGVASLRNLSSLKLRKGTKLTSAGLASLFRGNKMKGLTHLNLGECLQIENDTLESIASGCPLLTHLVLHWCWEVTDEGISHVVDNCSLLCVLDLVGVVRITGESLLKVPTSLPRLIILDLEQCNSVDDNILQKLASARSDLQVFDYWGEPVEPQNSEASSKDECYEDPACHGHHTGDS
ncbi:F-box and leucine-rich repeat protein 13-like [Oratosquilla oratoria]|uniref:F-box and leucine-rich repeat protein 13-like n=1 Tax=Oratosquilla oratoria TaxID=337810 RepID=UPI003F76C938